MPPGGKEKDNYRIIDQEEKHHSNIGLPHTKSNRYQSAKGKA